MIIAEHARVKSAFFDDDKNAVEKIIRSAIVEGETETKIFKHRVDADELRANGYEVKDSDLSPTLYDISRD